MFAVLVDEVEVVVILSVWFVDVLVSLGLACLKHLCAFGEVFVCSTGGEGILSTAFGIVACLNIGAATAEVHP